MLRVLSRARNSIHSRSKLHNLAATNPKKLLSWVPQGSSIPTNPKACVCPPRSSHRMASSVGSPAMGVFKFSDYDCIGFDLDHTLASYEIGNLVRLEYSLLSKFMIEQRGWDTKYLGAPLLDADLDFLQKGLMLDFDAGNVLKLGADGAVLRASHGTRLLRAEEIERAYPERRWYATDALVHDPLDTWNGAVGLKTRRLLDYFDMPASLAFARAVDALDAAGPPASYAVWPDILDGLIDMFDWAHFAADQGGFFPELKKNPGAYIVECSPETRTWLRRVKETKVTFLVTGSQADYADFIARHALGDDWRSLFDVIVCYARKPGFFTDQRPFIRISGNREDGAMKPGELTRGIYSQGNWRELREFLSRITNKEPECLYLGDNLIQDIYAPGARVDCHTVVLSEELRSESTPKDGHLGPDEKIINSQLWGSYFFHDEDRVKTLSCAIIEKYSKICVPSMETIAKHDIDHAYECFDEKNESADGFYPTKPRGLLSI